MIISFRYVSKLFLSYLKKFLLFQSDLSFLVKKVTFSLRCYGLNAKCLLQAHIYQYLGLQLG